MGSDLIEFLAFFLSMPGLSFSDHSFHISKVSINSHDEENWRRAEE